MAGVSDETENSLLGYLPQDFEYYPDFTALDFLLYIHFGSPGEITSEIDGLVWECFLPAGRAEHYAARLNASNLRNEGNNHVVLRVISEKMPVADAAQVQPNLEDLYLYYFREQQAGQTYSHGSPSALDIVLEFRGFSAAEAGVVFGQAV